MKLLSSKIKAYLAAVSALNMVLSLISVVSTYLMARVLQYAQTGDWRQTWGAILVCIGFLALSVVANIGCDALGQAMYGQARQDLRSSIMKSIFARPVSMFRERDDAYYFNLLTTDATTFCSDFLATIPMLVSWLGRIAACAVMLYFLHPVLMAVSLLASALPLLAQNVFNDLSTKAKNEFSAASEQYTAVMKETVEGYELIRMDGGKHRLLRRFDDYSQKECKKRMRSNFISCLSFQFFITSASLVQFIGLGTGAWLIAAGKLDAVLMIAAVNYVVQISNGFGNVIEYVTTVRSVKDIRKKLEREAEMQGPPAAASAGRENTLSYEDVSFSFGERKLYDHFSFTFQPGGCYALIGESGSGKSTLTKLLLKYHDSYDGRISLGGTDIRELSPEAVYEKVGVLSQNPFLFNASLYENITMFTASPAKDSAGYASLLKQVNLTALAERVGDAPLGDFGDNISGGERQRIALARCLREGKPIYIFDEPTTGLDPENIQIIQQAILNQNGATRIVISHDHTREYLDRFSGVVSLL